MALITDLAIAVLVEIFCRLPASDLLGRVRYTCKLFACIINDDPTLPHLHLERALAAPPGYLYTFKDNPDVYFVNNMLDNKSKTRRVPEGVRVTNGIGQTEIFGHIFDCNGLICYQLIEENETWFCLRNPFVGETLKIPADQVRQRTWGFGYARESKKYKIMRVMEKRKPLKRVIGAIYTVGQGVWRVLDIPPGSEFWRSPVYCSGVLYWSVPLTFASETKHQVVSFDFETETFQFSLLLAPDPRFGFGHTYLAVLGNTIALVVDPVTDRQYVLMRTDEASDTWTEMFHIVGPSGSFMLVGSWMNQAYYGLDRTYWCRLRERYHIGDGGERTYALYHAHSEEYTALRLPFVKDARAIASGLSPQLVLPHTGSLVSPQKIELGG